jgi:hypothetical protein
MIGLKWAAICLAVCGGSCAVMGCSSEDPVSSYLASSSDAAHDAHRSPQGEQLLLGAIVPYQGQGWFFKAVGPPAALEPEYGRFRQFISSLHFTDGQKPAAPSWTLPDGWVEEPGSGMRYATLRFGSADSPVELTVIGLPAPDAADEAYALANVNRWREQLKLTSIDAKKLAAQAEVIPLDGAEAILVQFRGEGSEPMASAAPHGPPPTPAPFHPPLTGTLTGADNHFSDWQSAQVKYEVPDGWTVGKVSEMRKAAFTVTDGEKSVEITIIDLMPEAGELLPNVNRWRQQLQLNEMTAEDLASLVENIRVGDAVGHYVALAGPGDANRPQTILAAVVLHGGKSWFIKLMGDAELAATEEERFKSFVRSVQF